MANKQIKNDITFFDKETFEPKCTYNGCADKFEIIKVEKTFTHYPNKKQKRDLTYKDQYRQCSECGQTVKLEVDNRQSKSNKATAIKDTVESKKSKDKATVNK